MRRSTVMSLPLQLVLPEETYIEGEGSVHLTSLYWLVLFSSCLYWNIIYLCYKTNYLNGEVNCTEPSLSVSVPWCKELPIYWSTSGGVLTIIHFLHNLEMGSISCNVCPLQAFSASCNVTLQLIGPIRKLRRKKKGSRREFYKPNLRITDWTTPYYKSPSTSPSRRGTPSFRGNITPHCS